MEIEIVGSDGEQALTGFFTDYAEVNPYRRYRLLTRGQKIEFISAELAQMIRAGSGPVFAAKEKGRIRGIAALRSLEWDSRHFAMRMASLDHFYADSASVRKRLLSGVQDECRRARIRHLSCRIDASDLCSAGCLEDWGCRLKDIKVSYVFYCQKQRICPLREIFSVRRFRAGDLQPLSRIIRERPWMNRFRADSTFPAEKVDSFYVEWLKNCCRGKCADMVLVAERSGVPAGFFTFLSDERFARAGLRCWGRGIAAVSPSAPGAYISLIKEALRLGLRRGVDIGEFDTQLSNYPVIRIYRRLGMEFTGSSLWFHKSLK